VVAGDVIEHLDNIAGFLGGVRRHLRPDGEVLILTPNPWFWMRIIQGMLGRLHENREHTAWYSPTTMTEMLRRSDFEVVEWEWGSSESWLYRVPVPAIFKHTSFWMAARPI
jgi:2-polyprenyl-3-methyl-5-hydroxy-6-metoxy-1,4-benzoquinol methylase